MHRMIKLYMWAIRTVTDLLARLVEISQGSFRYFFEIFGDVRIGVITLIHPENNSLSGPRPFCRTFSDEAFFRQASAAKVGCKSSRDISIRLFVRRSR